MGSDQGTFQVGNRNFILAKVMEEEQKVLRAEMLESAEGPSAPGCMS